MYINIGSNRMIRKKDIIGIFDLDSSSHEYDTKEFLKTAEKSGIIEVCGTDIPKAMILAGTKKESKVYLVTLSAASLAGRFNKD